MKALILKDFYVLWKQMRIFILVLLVIAVGNGAFGSVFIVIWAAMMPYTAMAYDERCKWNQMAAMMPYSTWDLVLSKYVLGWLCAGAAGVIGLLIQAAVRITGNFPESGTLLSILMGFCCSLCILSITLPLMFRFGVEKGRLTMFLLIFLVCASGGAIAEATVSDGGNAFLLPAPVLAMVPVIALVLTAVSIPLSLRLYRMQQ